MKKIKQKKVKTKELSFWKKLWFILEKEDKFKLLLILILQIIGSFFEVVGLGAIPVFIVTLARPKKVFDHEIAGPLLEKLHITENEQLLIWGAIALITIFILKSIYLVFVNVIKAKLLKKLQMKYGLDIFQKYMFADYIYLLSRNTAELLRNCVLEVSQVVLGVLQGILNLLMNVFLILNISVVLFVMEPIITLITISVVGSIAVIFMKITKGRLERLGKKAQRARKDTVLAVNQGLSGIKETRIMHAENFFIKAFNSALNQLARSRALQIVVSSSIKPLFETLAVAALLIITLLMYLQKRSLDSVIPLLSMFSIAMIRLLPAIRQITTIVSQLRFTFHSVNPVYESKFVPSSLEKRSSKIGKTNNDITFKNSIRLKNISYCYPKAKTAAVDNINLTIRKNEVVAFVGSSGAGKTTLVDIITGLLKPQYGKILIDGDDITRRMRLWQKHLGYIPQFIFLADDTLKNNVLWGDYESENAKVDILQSIKTAQLEELVKGLPDGINTVIGERGTRMSGGQRQRIGIARAVYRNPDVLVMDEATAALDNVTEKEITAAINRMKGHRTMIIIAHRLSTVKDCDRLYLMDKGKIIAQGTYDELLVNSPEFRALEGSQKNS